MLIDLQASAIWLPEVQSCLRLHTHVALVNNGLLLASEVFLLLLMAYGIYMRNAGPRAFKIMYREVWDHPSHVEPRV